MGRKRLLELLVWVLFGAFLLLGVYNQISVRKKTADYLTDASQSFENKLLSAEQDFNKWFERSKELKNKPFEAWYGLNEANPLPEEIVVWEGDSLIYWSGSRLTIDDISTLQPGYVALENLIG